MLVRPPAPSRSGLRQEAGGMHVALPGQPK
jgi:hypothetical protein